VLFGVLALLAALGLGGPTALGAPTATLLTVRNAQNATVSGAAVYKNCIYQGTTNASGQLSLTNVVAGDHLQVRKQVFTGPTSKGQHGGWAYHVWQTNIAQNDDGSQSDSVIANPANPQTVLISSANAQIGFNIVASVQYNATTANLQDIAGGLSKASEYLFDVSDGKMFFEQVTIYEDGQYFTDADLQYFVDDWPSASIGGPAGIAAPDKHITLPGPGFNGQTYTGSWLNTSGYRTIIHEWGHYGIGARDEYYQVVDDEKLDAICTLDRNLDPVSVRASIMDSQYNATELCAEQNHNPDTWHGQNYGESVWQTLFDAWNGNGASLRTPMSRGNHINPGPTTLSCSILMTPTIVESPVASCAPIPVQVLLLGTDPMAGMAVYLDHNGKQIYQGTTNSNGMINVYGAVLGDEIYISQSWKRGIALSGTYRGHATVTNCAPITINAQLWINAIIVPLPRFDPTIWEIDLFLNVAADGDPPRVRAFLAQDGLRRQEVALTYDAQRGGYSGRYAADRRRALTFALDLETYDARGTVGKTTYRYTAVQAQITGRAGELFAPHEMVSLTGDHTHLPDGLGVLAGETALPADPPEGWQAVGGPYTIEGSDRLSAPVTWTFPVLADPKQIDRASVAVYRYERDGWTPLPTTLNDVHSEATIQSSTWGIYAVFARPTH
jgi:hypothetical protein